MEEFMEKLLFNYPMAANSKEMFKTDKLNKECFITKMVLFIEVNLIMEWYHTAKGVWNLKMEYNTKEILIMA